MTEALYEVTIAIDDPDAAEVLDGDMIMDQLDGMAETLADRPLQRIMVCGWGYSLFVGVGFIMKESEAVAYKEFVEDNWGYSVRIKKQRKKKSP